VISNRRSRRRACEVSPRASDGDADGIPIMLPEEARKIDDRSPSPGACGSGLSPVFAFAPMAQAKNP
jgi:hypothetical protein